MPEIVFIEGVSGVGKTTTVKALHARLRARGYAVKSYVEFDFQNPIDFYCTAYIPQERYRELCQSYPQQAGQIKRYSIYAGEAMLVRYFDGDRQLFPKRLMGELGEMEFCYAPPHPVPLAEYTRTYKTVWENFDRSADGAVDYYIFDGSLLHHPLNDMIRNYDASMEQTAAHVGVLLQCLRRVGASVFYLFTEDVGAQLRLARQNRRQAPPDSGAVAFWEKRREYDEYVLDRSVPGNCRMDLTRYGHAAVLDRILAAL